MSRAIVAGVGMTPFGKHPDRSVEDLGAWAVTEALEDSGIDPSRIGAVIASNVLGNAVKYSAKSEPARIRVGYEQLDDGSHLFHVSDNGAGFDMQYAGKLFGVFQRLHSANEFPGTGVGLASVRRVLGRHGGRIWAEAEPGNGATFHFTLPASGQDAGANTTGTH